MNAPLLPEVLLGFHSPEEPQLPLAAQGVQRFVWEGHFGAGDGNLREHYARIGFRVLDGEPFSPAASLVIDGGRCAHAHRRRHLQRLGGRCAGASCHRGRPGRAAGRGQVGEAPVLAMLPRKAAEIAQVEAEGAGAQGDASLKELEERAQAQWQALVRGR